MLRISIFAYFLFLVISATFAQHTNESLVVPGKREEWVQSTIAYLKTFNPNKAPQRLELTKNEMEDFHKLSVRVIKEGLIELPGTGWIYIVTSSAHDNPEVGDISLAVDNKKNIYNNNGHVCGGIIHFETSEIRELKTSNEFFKYFVSDTDGITWEKIRSKH